MFVRIPIHHLIVSFYYHSRATWDAREKNQVCIYPSISIYSLYPLRLPNNNNINTNNRSTSTHTIWELWRIYMSSLESTNGCGYCPLFQQVYKYIHTIFSSSSSSSPSSSPSRETSLTFPFIILQNNHNHNNNRRRAEFSKYHQRWSTPSLSTRGRYCIITKRVPYNSYLVIYLFIYLS